MRQSFVQKSISYDELIGIFPDPETCRNWHFTKRFGDFECTRCGPQGKMVPRKSRQSYRCTRCHFEMNSRSGTIAANSQLPLTVWFEFLWLLSISRQLPSLKLLSVHLGISIQATLRMRKAVHQTLLAVGLKQPLVTKSPSTIVHLTEFDLVARRPGARFKRAYLLGAFDGKLLRAVALSSRSRATVEEGLGQIVGDGSRLSVPKSSSFQTVLSSSRWIIDEEIPCRTKFPYLAPAFEPITRFWCGFKKDVLRGFGGVSSEGLSGYVQEALLKRNLRFPRPTFEALMAACFHVHFGTFNARMDRSTPSW